MSKSDGFGVLKFKNFKILKLGRWVTFKNQESLLVHTCWIKVENLEYSKVLYNCFGRKSGFTSKYGQIWPN